MNKLKNFWTTLTIKNKTTIFTGSVFLIIIVAIFFDAILIRLFMIDVNNILEDNSRGGEIVAAIDREKESFDLYIDAESEENKAQLDKCISDTHKAIGAIDLDYKNLGENRYAQLFSIKTSYDVYCNYRDEVLSGNLDRRTYVSRLYAVYNMQDYLRSYAQRFVYSTLKEGNSQYQKLLPIVFALPLITIITTVVLFLAVMEISRMINKDITEPVMKLADASRRIAANDFYIDDVVADNKDEFGELISAFNKMKYATSEYIEALEERRVALDQLHVQEMETLEAEKQLDAMNLELLKNQINPHFLFNTLNVIAGMANLEGADTTEEMIGALSSLFRYNLKTQEKEILLSQEMKVASDYMYLQKMRFGDRVQYEVKCEVDPDDVLVPTFTLQPIIENCIIHGISPKVEGGKVLLWIYRKDDVLNIVIKDTGVGMSKDTLARIADSLGGKENSTMGIGMGNIYRRIKAMYDNSRMDINSTEGEGTTVIIIIPYKKGSEA